jgi:hypothetical protein
MTTLNRATWDATEDDLLAGMIATMGAAIVVARGLNKPVPSDDVLYLRLSEAGYTAVDILKWFEPAKAAAMGGQHGQL